MRSKVLTLIAAMVAVFALGCGEGDSTPSDSRSLTKKAFVAQADSICAKGVKEKDQVLKAGFKKILVGGQEPAKEDVEGVVLEIVPVLKETTSQLHELSPPAKDEQQVNAMLEEYDKSLKEAEDDPGSALTATFLKAPNEAARAYGLTSCSL